jgi:hypothetical protein
MLREFKKLVSNPKLCVDVPDMQEDRKLYRDAEE